MNKKFLLLLIPITTLVLSGCGKRSPGGSTSGDDPTTVQPTSGAPTSGTTGGSSGTTGTTGGSSTTGSSSSSSSGTTSGSTSGSTSEDPGHYVPVHAGTETDPFDAVDAYNVAAELESCKSAGKKAEMDTDQQYFVRGVVTEFVEAWSSSYGNYHFKIGDSQTPFIGYRLFNGPTKAKFPLGTELEVGDTVTMYATLIHWYDDMETNDGYIYSIQKATTRTLASITLSGQKTSYIEGQSFVKPVVTAHYSDETENEVTATAVFTGFDSSTPVASQTINVSYTEGGVEKTTSYTVTINAKKLSSIAVSGQKTSYIVGDTFVKPTVTATYDNGTNAVVTESAVFTGFDSSAVAASQTINVSYTEGGVEKTTSFTVTINASAIHVTGVSIDATLELNVGDTHTLVPTISPDNATDKVVTWAVEGDSPANCVTVDENTGLITANAAGTAEVVVTTHDGGLSDSCTVTVTDSSVIPTGRVTDDNWVEQLGPVVGTDLIFGCYDDDSDSKTFRFLNGTITSYYPMTTTDTAEALRFTVAQVGDKYTARVTSSGDLNGKYLAIVVSGTHVNGVYQDSPCEFDYFEEITSIGKAKAYNNKDYCFAERDGNYESLGPTAYDYWGSNFIGRFYKYEEPAAVDSFAIKTCLTSYIVGDHIDPSSLVITVTYEGGGDPEDVPYVGNEGKFSFVPALTKELETTDELLTITFGGKNTSTAISVTEDTLLSIAITGTNMTKKSYIVGDSWNPAGLVVTGTYNISGDRDVTAQVDNWTYDPATANNTSVTSVGVIAHVGALASAEETINGITVSNPVQKWTKVTSGTVEAGDYLIVYETGNKAFNGALTTLDAVNNTIAVSISSSEIEYSNATAAVKFTIAAVSGGYTIQSASGYYIGRTANSNGIHTSTSEAYVNTISISSGNAVIKGSGSGASKQLMFNTASDQQRFRYVGSGAAIALYKLSSN